MELDVLCVGTAAQDTICTVEDFPGSDDRVVTDDFTVAGGGPAATAAVALARLGVKAGFCGVVGDDAVGDQVVLDLEADGVDTRWVIRDPTVRTAQSFVIATRSSGTRSIVTTRAPAPRSDQVPRGVARIVHVDQSGYAPVVESRLEGDADALLSIDGGNVIAGLSMDDVWLYAPSLTALLHEFPGPDAGTSAQDARARGAQIVVATDGDRQSLWSDSAGLVTQPSFRVPVVSSLGAGDVFHGALLAAIVNSLDRGAALRWASAAAALSCGGLGGRSHIPTSEELKTFLDTHPTRTIPEAGIEQELNSDDR